MDKRQQTFSINFFIKRHKLLKNGEAPIVVRISVCGQVGDIFYKTKCSRFSLGPNQRALQGKGPCRKGAE